MKSKIFLTIVIILFVLGNLIYFSPGKLELVDANPKPTPLSLPAKGTTKLKSEDTQVGTGKEVKAGDSAVLHYIGKLADGKEFENSYDNNQPITVELGAGQVIKGWDEGIPGMKVGGKRTLTIPPDLAYGETGSPPNIPPNATLIFEVELLEIK